METKSLRVLHCPTLTGGNPIGLARAERELGLQSSAITLQASRFEYEADATILRPGESEILLELKRWGLLWKAIRRFDVIHFNFGRTIMPVPSFGTSPSLNKYPRIVQLAYNTYARMLALCDLPLLKRLGKKIVVTYQGDDARQGDYCRTHFEITAAKDEVESWYYSTKSDAFKRWSIKQFNKYADQIYALNPDLMHVLPSRTKFVPYASVDPRDWQPVYQNHSDRPIRILHAPSHRAFKGTKYILEAINSLRDDGIQIELLIVEDMSHAQAKELYKKADILIDQVLAGWYGALAVELMALGKPVMCYLREEDLVFIPPDMRADIPIINVNPVTLYPVLKEWISERQHQLVDVGRQGRRYVERWHNPLEIAARLKADYED
jgi:glycosyltransferase involved in cell wall biosynthesis